MKKIKIITKEFPEFVGKPIQELYDHLKKIYPDRLPYDGVDFYDNERLKDGNYHFFFGSVFRDSDGDWYVPCVRWGGSRFDRDGFWLGDGWDADYRVAVLQACELPIESDAVSFESLKIEIAKHAKRIAKLEKKLK